MDFKLISALEPHGYRPQFCPCNLQRCKGQFIPSRVGQTECLFSLAQSQKLDQYPLLEMERFTIQLLILHLVNFNSAPEAQQYDENLYTVFETEEMVEEIC